MQSRTVKRVVVACSKLAAVLILAGVVTYLYAFRPVAVRSVEVRAGDVLAEVTGTGTLEARTKATISPKISGRLAQILVDQGARVTAGQLLAQLDDGDLKQQVEVAKAELRAAGATVDRSAADITRAEARARLTHRVYERLSPLRGTGAVSEDVYDKATEDRDVAEAELSRAKLAKVEAERQAGKAEQSLRYYEERLADTRIVAPFDGLVVGRDRDPGDVVVPGGAIIDLISTEQLWVSAWVDETTMNELGAGQPARILFRSDPAQSYTGTVDRLSPQTDRESREFLVDVAMKRLPRTWSVGQRAEVYINTGRREGVLALPQRAIVWREKQPNVIVIDGGKARWRAVVLGLRGAENVEIVEGLRAGQRVAVLQPGEAPPREGRAVKVTR